MIKAGFARIAISVIAIICNAVLFCLLIYAIFVSPPKGAEIYIPVVYGLFFILNVVAIALRSGAYKSVAAQTSSFTRGSKIRFIVFVILLLAFMCIGFWLGLRFHDRILSWRQHRTEQVRIAKYSGKKAPDFVTQRLDGNEWRLQDQRGKVVLIDFWATWCGPCISSLPNMKEIYEKYKSRDDFVMVGVSLDRDKQALVEFGQKHGIAWTQLFEESKHWNNSVTRAFGLRGIPSVWIINKEGDVVGKNIHSHNIDEITRIIEKSLNK